MERSILTQVEYNNFRAIEEIVHDVISVFTLLFWGSLYGIILEVLQGWIARKNVSIESNCMMVWVMKRVS
jgi:hypothetical protein